MDSGFSWSVDIPGRRQAAIGQRRPQGTVTVTTDARGTERLSVPLAVARKLTGEQKRSAAGPSSRNELIFHIREVQRVCGHTRLEALVDRRDYSTKELSDKLMQEGYWKDVTGDLVRHAQEAGLVDDARYAHVYIRSKMASGWGQVRIARELSRKGIDVNELDGWPYEYFEGDSERERAFELAARKRLTGKNDYAKLMRFLLSRGFSSADASAAAARVLEEAKYEE